LSDRVAALEVEIARLKAKLEDAQQKEDPWIRDVSGAFAGDLAFLEAMRLGREYRESTRPKPRKRRIPPAARQGKAR
jgi:hypothetical protein